MKPVRCYAGQYFGGYPAQYGAEYGKAKLCAIEIVLDKTTADRNSDSAVTDADLVTELELEDWHALRTTNVRKRDYQTSRCDRVFTHKSGGQGTFRDFGLKPLDCVNGIKVRTNTNCRPILWIA